MTELGKAIAWLSKVGGKDEADIEIMLRLGVLTQEDVLKTYRVNMGTHVYCKGCQSDITNENQFDVCGNIFCNNCALDEAIDRGFVKLIR